MSCCPVTVSVWQEKIESRLRQCQMGSNPGAFIAELKAAPR
jgi:hypothetical protein